jgi:hypothetical protein
VMLQKSQMVSRQYHIFLMVKIFVEMRNTIEVVLNGNE